MNGEAIYAFAKELFPICRSLTGPGVLQTLEHIQAHLPELSIRQVPSGTQAFDWTVPKEWAVRGAYIENEAGERVIDFSDSNLHVMGYSTPVDEWMPLEALRKHIYTWELLPDAIPYVTSYYKERWGFCMSRRQLDALPDGRYHAVIDSVLFDGQLTYGEWVLPGNTEEEVLLSTYICHPSLANNELSGPCVAVALAKWLATAPRRYTYRLLFLPETIGAVVYLSTHYEALQKHVIAGFVLTCVGDDRAYSYVPSRAGDTLADRAARNVLYREHPDFISYSYLDRGSDERQYNAPGIDLPVCSVMRSKYGTYPEYHTSADDLSLITPEGLQGALDVYRSMMLVLENNGYPRILCLCEPQLGKRGLYPTESYRGSADAVRDMMNFIAYADGRNDMIAISDVIGVSVETLWEIKETLAAAGLMEFVYA